MLSIERLKEFTGFTSWLEFYKIMVTSDWFKAQHDIISLLRAKETWKIAVIEIKAAAFDELFSTMLTKEELNKGLLEARKNTFGPSIPWELLNKIPTKD